MKKYIGVKLIQAEPQIKDGKEGYKVVYPDGYVSWSPKEVFEEAYRTIDNMTFGLAIEALKKGYKVARKGWNGKGMYLWLYKGTYYLDCDNNKVYTNPLVIQQDNVPTEFFNIPLQQFILMKTADNTYVPWLASQTDMLAEDWIIVD